MNRAIVTKLTTGDPSLESALIDAVLVGLGISVSRPDRSTLDTLMNRYIKMAPWESAYRIVWRSQCSSVSECPRWPKEFWEQHLTLGTGGTCFESNCALCQQDR